MSRLRRLATVLLEKDMQSIAPGLREEMESLAKGPAAPYPIGGSGKPSRGDSFNVMKKRNKSFRASEQEHDASVFAAAHQAEMIQAANDAAQGQAGIADLPAFLVS